MMDGRQDWHTCVWCMHLLLYVSIKDSYILHTVIEYIASEPIRWLHSARQPAVEPKRKTVKYSNPRKLKSVVFSLFGDNNYGVVMLLLPSSPRDTSTVKGRTYALSLVKQYAS